MNWTSNTNYIVLEITINLQHNLSNYLLVDRLMNFQDMFAWGALTEIQEHQNPWSPDCTFRRVRWPRRKMNSKDQTDHGVEKIFIRSDYWLCEKKEDQWLTNSSTFNYSSSTMRGIHYTIGGQQKAIFRYKIWDLNLKTSYL